MLAINWYKITFFYKGIIRKVKNRYPPPPIFWKYTTHLRCRFIKNSPRRTSSTPVGVFYTLLASALSISKRNFKTDTDVRDTKQKRCFCSAKTRRQQMYTEVHLLAGYLHRLFPKGFFSQYTTHLLHRRNIASLIECQWVYPAVRIKKIAISSFFKEINSS